MCWGLLHAGVGVSYEKFRFRRGLSSTPDAYFERDQIWVQTDKDNIDFVDESAEIIASYNAAGEGDAVSDASQQPIVPQNAQPHPALPSASFVFSSGSAPQPFSPGTQNTPREAPKSVNTDGKLQSRLEAVLLRYFVEENSAWFDVCHLDRHFARVVPQRAHSWPPLLDAIFTASARHITSLRKFRNSAGGFSWSGVIIPSLDEDTPLHHHNFCQINNQDLLAAAIVLRFYEEIDSPLEKNNATGVLLRVLNIFVNALMEIQHLQLNAQSSPLLFRVAFRQELCRSFMIQQPFTLPLSRWESYCALKQAGTGTWTDRLVLSCADVLDENLPSSVEPLYTRDAGCHATGTAHLELGKILLAAFDPTRPKLGHGHLAAERKLTTTMRSTVVRLCVIALSIRRSPSAFYAWPTRNIAEKRTRA
ncbi:hypothetical protein BJX64DRAFT_279361 [Aspergillus heterothallicus]